MYTNPLTQDTCPDPYVLEHQGVYYCYGTGAEGVVLFISDDLVHWKRHGFVYHSTTEQDYWAPSVIYLNGTFYMYYSSVSEGQQEECLKVATSNRPDGPFSYVKQFFTWFSIDSQPVLWNGNLYMFYSTNTETGTLKERPGTAILIDRMKTPLEFAGEQKVVVRPSIDQEIFQRNRFEDGRDWHTIEGASFLSYGDRLFLLYSANAYINEDYYVGFAAGESRFDLHDVYWKKYPNDYSFHPLLKRTDHVEGTGHNSIAKAPNMIDDWIIYHGRNSSIPIDYAKEERVLRIDRLYQDGDRLYCDGPSHTPQTAPSQPDKKWNNLNLFDDVFMAIPSGIATAQVWMVPEPSHTGVTYGLILGSYRISCTVGKNSLELFAMEHNICRKIEEIQLSPSFNHFCPHVWRVNRVFDWWTVSLDDVPILKDRQFGTQEGGIFSTCSTVCIADGRVTYGANLMGTSLSAFGHLFAYSKQIQLTQSGLKITGHVDLVPKFRQGTYQITLNPISHAGKLEILGARSNVLITLSLQRARTFGMEYTRNEFFFMGNEYMDKEVMIRITDATIECLWCKNLE